MKLIVIVLCLFAERFLVHHVSTQRFGWFDTYLKKIHHYLPKEGIFGRPLSVLLVATLPILLLTSLILYFVGGLLFGFIGLLLNVAIFYYCLGPDNPFYPAWDKTGEQTNKDSVATYLANVNGQLFAVILWYVVSGPIGLLAYRLISMTQADDQMGALSRTLTSVL